jgi:hypothetical protein
MTDIELFEHNFMLTGDNADPRDLDFRFYVYERIIRNPDGTPAQKQYYRNYDSASDTFSNLAVQSNYTYVYDSQMLRKRIEDISWFLEDGEIGVTRQLVQVFQ